MASSQSDGRRLWVALAGVDDVARMSGASARGDGNLGSDAGAQEIGSLSTTLEACCCKKSGRRRLVRVASVKSTSLEDAVMRRPTRQRAMRRHKQEQDKLPFKMIHQARTCTGKLEQCRVASNRCVRRHVARLEVACLQHAFRPLQNPPQHNQYESEYGRARELDVCHGI